MTKKEYELKTIHQCKIVKKKENTKDRKRSMILSTKDETPVIFMVQKRINKMQNYKTEINQLERP